MTIRKDLNIVQMYVQKKWYNIRCGKPKITRKQSSNLRRACNSYLPYEVNMQEEEVSVELPDIDQSQRWLFTRILDRQKSGKFTNRPVLVIYKYDSKGALVKDYHLQGVYFEDIDQEGNEPFTAKGGAIDPVKL